MNGFQRQCILSFAQHQIKTALTTLKILQDRNAGEFEQSPLLELAGEFCFKASISLATAYESDIRKVYEQYSLED